MKATTPGPSILLLTVFGIVVTMATPMAAFAQGRGNGRDFDKLEKKRQKEFDKFEKKGQKDFEKRERKREKFVNGHDARDGRWDGRGPSRTDRFDRADRRWDSRHSRWNRRAGRWVRTDGRRDRKDLARYQRRSR